MDRETHNNMTDLEQQAKAIIGGFLSRFPAPECVEQQEVVQQAERWLIDYGVEVGNNNAWWARFQAMNVGKILEVSRD